MTFIFQPPKSVVSVGLAEEGREKAFIITGPDIAARIR